MPDGSVFSTEVDYLLRITEVERHTGLGRSSIYRRMAEGTFPEPVALGGGQVRWRQSEIRGWVEARPKVSFRRDGKLGGPAS